MRRSSSTHGVATADAAVRRRRTALPPGLSLLAPSHYSSRLDDPVYVSLVYYPPSFILPVQVYVCSMTGLWVMIPAAVDLPLHHQHARA